MNRKENVINIIHWLEEAFDLNIPSLDEEISSSDEATSSEIETNKSSINWEFKYAITETSKESTLEITETSVPISEVTSFPISEVIETLVKISEVINISIPTSEVRDLIPKRIKLIYNNLVINYNKKKIIFFSLIKINN